MFPEVFRAQRELRPKAILIENVYGLARPSFRPYLEYILLQLRFPFVTPDLGEGWRSHKERLLAHSVAARFGTGDTYDVDFRVINAADYGVPQIRRRLLIVGFRADLGVCWSWNAVAPTFSKEALEYALWGDGSYRAEHGIERPPGSGATDQQNVLAFHGRQRWRTLRDALKGLPTPVDGKEHPSVRNHVGIPGARLYAGHTGNTLDRPAKAIKAGGHGNPGGEHVVILDDGSHRYLTVRECARIQGFPDELTFQCSRTEAMRQLGNAVPVPLAEVFGKAIFRVLDESRAASRSDTPVEAALT
jgi:DNA (cytosine-5)-methyltransferase 1